MKNYKSGQVGERPWGQWKVLDVTPHAIVKKIVINPGHRLSLQKHDHRAETWTVAQGVASIECDKYNVERHVSECFHIPQGCIHRLANKGEEPLIVIEIQMGEVLDEEDIERYEDDYSKMKEQAPVDPAAEESPAEESKEEAKEEAKSE